MFIQKSSRASWLNLIISVNAFLLLPPLCLCEQPSMISYGASDDASWTIQSSKISTMLAYGKQEFYDNYIEKCEVAAMEYHKQQGLQHDTRFCRHNDDYRINMNRLQPASVYNYTDMGFKKIRAPLKLFNAVRDFYEINKNKSAIEWTSVNTYQNLWDVPSTFVQLEDDSLVGGGREIQDLVWEEARLVLEEWTGQKLKPVSLYGVREYHRGSILVPHVDRMPLVSSAIINVDQKGMDEPWVLEVYGHDGKATNVTMEVGDMVLYESHSVIHGRPFPLQGELYCNVFVHYEPSDTSSYDPKLGLPPYIIPGSSWESFWRADNPDGWLPHNNKSDEESLATRSAVHAGDVEKLRHIGANDPESLHQPDKNGWRPFHEAVRAGNIEVMKLLLDHGADVNQETYYQQNPLSIARQFHGNGHEVTKFLLEMGAIGAEQEL